MLISIVIPCYYSRNTIRKEVEMILEEFAKNDGYDCEFVLVNDGSTDGTYDEIKATLEGLKKNGYLIKNADVYSLNRSKLPEMVRRTISF